jgi:DNA helicase HerA-like ATPase
MNLYSTLQTAPETETGTPHEPALAPKRFAHVVSVSGCQAIAVLEKSELAKATRVELGALVKIPTGLSSVVGLVSGLSSPMPGPDDGEELALVEINLAGEILAEKRGGRLSFRRGVGTLPAIGEGVYIADWNDLSRIYADADMPGIEIGTLYQDVSVPACLSIDRLFGKHFLIAGASGCGKSSALAAILQGVVEEHTQARIVVLDLHNEYGHSFGEKAERIGLGKLRLPYWLLSAEELTAVFTTAGRQRERETEILAEAVLAAKRRYFEGMRARRRRSHAGLDTALPFRFSDVIAHIDARMERLDGVDEGPCYRRVKSRLEAVLGDERYGFMFGSDTVNDSLTEILARIFRVPSDGRAITVLELGDVPDDLVEIVTSLIARLGFELAVWGDGDMKLLLVCEDAHRFAPARAAHTTLAGETLTRIAREGRRHGVSLGLLTERPSELDTAILAECGTAIAMRLTTDRDQDVMRAHTQDGGLGLLDFLPLLAEREAIVLGAGAPLPMRLKISDLPTSRAPKKRHLGFAAPWKQSNFDLARLEEAVARWQSLGKTETA